MEDKKGNRRLILGVAVSLHLCLLSIVWLLYSLVGSVQELVATFSSTAKEVTQIKYKDKDDPR